MKLLAACSTACARADQRFLEGAPLGDLLRALPSAQWQRPALVTGGRWLADSGWQDRVVEALAPVCILRVIDEPHVLGVRALQKQLGDSGARSLVAIGGGSVMDMAKVLAVVDPAQWGEQAILPQRAIRLPLAVVPTTAGTGSEVTPYASFISELGRKFSYADNALIPAAVIHAPALLVDQPTALAADVIADALSQGIESAWSKRATAESRGFAGAAIAALVAHGVDATMRPTSAGKGIVLSAALLAGAAIAISQTTLVHAVSYPVTARFKVPHGRALAVLLPRFMRFVERGVEPVARECILSALGASSWGGAVARVEGLFRELGLPSTLRAVGVPQDAARVIIREGYRADRMSNSPVVPTEAELEALLAQG